MLTPHKKVGDNVGRYERFRHLRRALFWTSGTTVMIVTVRPFTLHGDDSGKKQSRMLVVAGYVAEAARWEIFQEKWKRRIVTAGLDEFKRSSFDEKADGASTLLRRLRELIHEHTSFGFGYGIDNDGWRAVNKDYALELYHLVPYSLCARTCIALARHWCRRQRIATDHIAYIFDKGSEGAGELTELLKIDQSAEARKVVSSLSSADSIDLAGLQAADYLAWGFRAQLLKNPNSKDLEGNPELAHLLKYSVEGEEPIPRFGFYYERDLRDLCRRAKVALRKDVPSEIWRMKGPIRLKWPSTQP